MVFPDIVLFVLPIASCHWAGGLGMVRSTKGMGTTSLVVLPSQPSKVTRGGRGLPLLPDATTDSVAWAYHTASLAPYSETIGSVVHWWLETQAPFQHALTIGEAVSEYLAHCQSVGRSPQTIRSNASVLGRLADELGAVLPSQVTPENVRAALSKPCAGENLTKLNPNTITTRLLRTGAFFTWCAKRGYCKENPCRRLESAKPKWREPGTYSIDESRRLLNSARLSGVARQIVLGLFCGLRPSESAAIRESNINIEDGHLCLTSGKTGIRRQVELTPVAIAWLTDRRNEPWEIKDTQQVWADVYEFAKVVKKYDGLRHSFASYHAPIKGLPWVSDQLGHANLKMARQAYVGIKTKAEANQFINLFP